MERRSFLRITSSAVAGGLILPHLALGTGGTNSLSGLDSLYQIPKAAGHVRHGLFQLEAIQQPLIPSWLTLFKRHRFFQNGVEESTSDLNTFTCKVGDRLYTLGYDGQSCYLIQGEDVFEATESNEDAPIRILSGSIHEGLHAGKERVVIVLEGQCRINSETFLSEEFLVSDEELSIIQSGDEALTIVIDQSS